MRIEGRHLSALPRERVWERLVDPDVLRRCAPGVKRLEPAGPDRYDVTLELALPAVKGRFEGSIAFTGRSAPEALSLEVQGKGAPGFASGDVALRLSEADGATEIHYTADVQVGGSIARLGQRMISGIAKDMAAQFFEAFDRLETAPPGASAAPSPLRAFLDLLRRTLRRWLSRGD